MIIIKQLQKRNGAIANNIMKSMQSVEQPLLVTDTALNEAIEKGIVADIDHIDVIDVLVKGAGGKNINKLQKKTITDKNGHQRIVYVKTGGDGKKTTSKNVDSPITMDVFKDLAKNSDNLDDFMSKVRSVKNVPKSVSDEFTEKYTVEGGGLYEAVLNFMSQHGKSEQDFNPNGIMQKKDISPEDMKKIEGHEDKLSHINRIRYNKMMGKKDTTIDFIETKDKSIHNKRDIIDSIKNNKYGTKYANIVKEGKTWKHKELHTKDNSRVGVITKKLKNYAGYGKNYSNSTKVVYKFEFDRTSIESNTGLEYRGKNSIEFDRQPKLDLLNQIVKESLNLH